MAPTPRRFDTIEYPPEQNPFADQDDSMSDGDSNKASNSNNNNNKKANLNSSNASSTSVDSAAAKAVKDKNERYENEYENITKLNNILLYNDNNNNNNYNNDDNIYQNIPLYEETINFNLKEKFVNSPNILFIKGEHVLT